tara:strand:- start:130 stop:618 length:489 start_codon:yes stop_codon:yes gene_type:complete
MAALDKLIDLLEQIKETDPSFTKKAGKALNALIGDDEEETIEVSEEDIEAEAPEPPPIPEPEEEEQPVEKVYPDVVEVKGAHLKEIQDEQKAIAQKISELGLLLQNYESDKERLLEYIEQKQKYLVEYISKLREVYDLDPSKEYAINFPQKEGEKATFTKTD